MSTNILDTLYDILKSRKDSDIKQSYVASLYNKGTDKIAEKIGEEAIETIIEAVKRDRDALKEESADLLFHLMVLWADQDIEPHDVLKILQDRFGTSGHEEKANRT